MEIYGLDLAPTPADQLPVAGRRRCVLGALAVATAALLGTMGEACASLIVAPTPVAFDLVPGQLGIVRGDITNTTGFDLLGSDFFASFSGYDVNTLVVEQLLGLTAVALRDRTVTRDVALFSVQLGAAAQAGQRYAVEFFFGDVNGNFSVPATVEVNVRGSQAVPEPGTAWLVGGTLLALAVNSRRSVRHTGRD